MKKRPYNDHTGNEVLPLYELRARQYKASDMELEVWQLPAVATPHLKSPRRIAGLKGRNLALIEHRILRQLKQDNIDPIGMLPGEYRRFEITERMALRLGLMFRILAPMRKNENMRACSEGIEAMEKEEAAYWLGMTMHRKYPRRVLMALRFLLIDPNGKGK